MTQLLEAANANSININQNNIKKFANRLKKSLEKDNIKFKTSKCYDLIAQTLGSSDWHELSQQLNTVENSNKSIAKISNQPLVSIFDKPWNEFKYFISQICEQMQYGEQVKILTLSLLEIVKDRNKSGSHLLWNKVDMLLSYIGFDILVWVNQGTNLDYCFELNNVEEFVKSSIKENLLPFFFRTNKQDDRNKISLPIIKIFKLLQYLHKENLILEEPFSEFKRNDIFANINNYPVLCDLRNYIYNFHTLTSFSLHQAIFDLYSKRIDNELDNDMRSLFQAKDNVIKSFLNDLDFCAYIMSNIKERVFSHIETEVINDTLKINFTVSYLLPHELAQFINSIIETSKQDIKQIDVYFKINQNSPNISYLKETKQNIFNKFNIALNNNYYIPNTITINTYLID